MVSHFPSDSTFTIDLFPDGYILWNLLEPIRLVACQSTGSAMAAYLGTFYHRLAHAALGSGTHGTTG